MDDGAESVLTDTRTAQRAGNGGAEQSDGTEVFGFVKGKFTGVSKMKSALQTVLVGGLAAGVAYALAKLIS